MDENPSELLESVNNNSVASELFCCELARLHLFVYSSREGEGIKSLSPVKFNYTPKYLESIQWQIWSFMYQASISVVSNQHNFNLVRLQHFARDQDCHSTSRIWSSMSSEDEVAVK